MTKILRTIAAPILSLIILITGNGLFTTFLPVRLQLEGFPQEMAGYVTAAFFAGLTLGSLYIHHIIQRIGHIRAFANFASGMAVCVILQAFFVDPWMWMILRFFSGVFIAGLFITIESWLIIKSSAGNKGQILSVYMIAFYGAQSAGQFLLKLSDPASILPFLITALLCSFAVMPISMTKFREPIIEDQSVLNIFKLFILSPLGMVAALFAGLFLGAIYGMLPFFCKEIHFTTAQVSNLMGFTILGALLLQWPIGRLSDVIDRRKILFATAIGTTILAITLFFIPKEYSIKLLIVATLFGGFSFTIYPLSISHACDSIEEKDSVAALGGLNVAYGIGAVLGPIGAAYLMKLTGPYGLFLYFIIISIMLAIYTFWKIQKVKPIPQDEKQPFRNMPRTTPLVIELDPRGDEDISVISRNPEKK